MNKAVSDTYPPYVGILLLGLVVAWGVSYWPTLGLLLEEWAQGGGVYSHGFLVLAIMAYLVWKQREQLARCDIRPNALGLLLAVLAGGVWAVGFLSNVFLLQLLGVVALLLASVLAIFGRTVFQRVWFPIVFILFASPVWGWLEHPLRVMTTEVSYLFIKLIDVPVFRDGYSLSVPGGQFLVEESCAGVSFFLTALTLGVLFAHVNQLGMRKGIFFVAYSLALAIISNWLRVIVIILVGNYTHMQHPIVQDHITFGWILYAFMLIPLFWVGAKLVSGQPAADPDSGASSAAASLRGTERLRALRAPVSVIGLAGLLLLPPLTARLADHGYEQAYGHVPPQAAGDWRLVSHGEQLDWEPHYVGASSHYRAVYRSSAAPVYLYIGNYNKQTQGRELINVENRLYPRSGWVPREERAVSVDLAEGQRTDVNELVLEAGSMRRLIWYWYEVGARRTISPARAKLYDLLGIVAGERGASVFALATDYHGSKDEAAARLHDFLSVSNLYKLGTPARAGGQAE